MDSENRNYSSHTPFRPIKALNFLKFIKILISMLNRSLNSDKTDPALNGTDPN